MACEAEQAAVDAAQIAMEVKVKQLCEAQDTLDEAKLALAECLVSSS